jgi:fatty acid desaturase
MPMCPQCNTEVALAEGYCPNGHLLERSPDLVEAPVASTGEWRRSRFTLYLMRNNYWLVLGFTTAMFWLVPTVVSWFTTRHDDLMLIAISSGITMLVVGLITQAWITTGIAGLWWFPFVWLIKYGEANPSSGLTDEPWEPAFAVTFWLMPLILLIVGITKQARV